MSGLRPIRPVWTKIRLVIAVVILSVAIQFAARVSGFGTWLHTNPWAIRIMRFFATVICGGGAVLLLFGDRTQSQGGARSDRFLAISLTIFATLNAVLLVRGETAFQQFLPE